MIKPTSEARKILAEATGHPSVRKYAFVGASILLGTIVNLIASAAGLKDTRHFATEEKALAWIMEDRK